MKSRRSAPENVARRIVGHVADVGAHGAYGRGFGVKVLSEWLDKVEITVRPWSAPGVQRLRARRQRGAYRSVDSGRDSKLIGCSRPASVSATGRYSPGCFRTTTDSCRPLTLRRTEERCHNRKRTRADHLSCGGYAVTRLWGFGTAPQRGSGTGVYQHPRKRSGLSEHRIAKHAEYGCR